MPFERSFSAGILTPIVTAAPEVHDAVPSDAHDAATGAVSAKGQADEERRKAVKAALMHSWEGYKKYAWGTDELKPQARSGHNWLGQGGTIIDAMSTLAIMGELEEFKKAAAWVKSELHFGCVPHARPRHAPRTRMSRGADQPVGSATGVALAAKGDVSFFETTIRVLGGLLSSYETTCGLPEGCDQGLLDKARECGDRLLKAFSSPSGLPYATINMQSGHGRVPVRAPPARTLGVRPATRGRLTPARAGVDWRRGDPCGGRISAA